MVPRKHLKKLSTSHIINCILALDLKVGIYFWHIKMVKIIMILYYKMILIRKEIRNGFSFRSLMLNRIKLFNSIL